VPARGEAGIGLSRPVRAHFFHLRGSLAVKAPLSHRRAASLPTQVAAMLGICQNIPGRRADDAAFGCWKMG
jgi:hypothetical protein